MLNGTEYKKTSVWWWSRQKLQSRREKHDGRQGSGGQLCSRLSEYLVHPKIWSLSDRLYDIMEMSVDIGLIDQNRGASTSFVLGPIWEPSLICISCLWQDTKLIKGIEIWVRKRLNFWVNKISLLPSLQRSLPERYWGDLSKTGTGWLQPAHTWGIDLVRM